MTRKTMTLKKGKVDESLPHFIIFYSEEYGCDDWQKIATLSLADTVNNMRLEVLDGVGRDILKKLRKELNFYLFELQNSCPVSYLCYHAKSTMSNIYSHIHFSLVSGE